MTRTARNTLAITLGLGAALLLGVSLGAGGKLTAVALLVLAAAALLPVCLWFGLSLEHLGLFTLMATLSLSLKFHPLFRPGHLGGAVGLRIGLTDLLLAALAALILTRPHSPIRLSAPRALVLCLTLWLVFAGISTFAGPDPELGLFQIAATLQGFALFLFLSNYVNRRQRLTIVFLGLLAGLLLQAAVTVAQWRFPGRFEFAFLGSQEQTDVSVSDTGEIDLPDVDLGQTTIGGEIITRPMGLLIHSNLLAVFLVTQVLLMLAWAHAAASPFLRACAFGSVLLGGVALYASFSRSGWGIGAAGIGLLLALAWRWRALQLRPFERAVTALAAAGLLVALVRVAPSIYLRLTETAHEAVSFRTSLNHAALRMWADHPVTGAGLNTFVQHVVHYDPSGMSRYKTFPAHNIFLLELGETGLGGCAVMLALAAFSIYEAWRRARSCRSPAARLYGVALLAGIVCFWTADLFAFSFRIPVMAGLLWTLLALAIANQSIDAQESGVPENTARPKELALA